MPGGLFRRAGNGGAPDRAPLSVTLYTRADCPLCDEMKAELARARTDIAYVLHERDIAGDPELLRRHGLSVPVLEIEGRIAFEGRLGARAFERELARRARELADARGSGPEHLRG